MEKMVMNHVIEINSSPIPRQPYQPYQFWSGLGGSELGKSPISPNYEKTYEGVDEDGKKKDFLSL